MGRQAGRPDPHRLYRTKGRIRMASQHLTMSQAAKISPWIALQECSELALMESGDRNGAGILPRLVALSRLGGEDDGMSTGTPARAPPGMEAAGAAGSRTGQRPAKPASKSPGYKATPPSRMHQRAGLIVGRTANAAEALACIGRYASDPIWYRALAAAARRRFGSDPVYSRTLRNMAEGVSGDGVEALHLCECVLSRRNRSRLYGHLSVMWRRAYGPEGRKQHFFGLLMDCDVGEAGVSFPCPECCKSVSPDWGGRRPIADAALARLREAEGEYQALDPCEDDDWRVPGETVEWESEDYFSV
uniref:Uncharacterized protein n=1 Tax=Jiamusi Totiv tick virus 1 TaxID=2972346 RepID=A0A9E7V2H8_9VIRU|nr:MAG: hypothetical protein [Jiamusi Totiv tick virus 1]WAK77367.1 MAG: hypothetical protein [Totiviridae sp.]